MTISALDTTPSFTTRQQRLRASIAILADRIVAGEMTTSQIELEQVVGLCEDYALPQEAARVRRWMTP
jgi:hypothetical protein